MSQTELANKLGIKLQTLSVWLTGKRNPKEDTLERIANALNVPVRELTEDKVIKKNNFEKGYVNSKFQLKLKELEIKILDLEKNFEERILKLEKKFPADKICS